MLVHIIHLLNKLFILFNKGCVYMGNIILIVKGLFIGLAKVIPGVSGAILAISLGVYDKLLESITHFFNNKKENFKLLLYIGIGILIAIILGSKLIYYCLDNYFVITMLFFIGLIFGSTPKMFNKIRKDKVGYLYIFISFMVMMIITLFKSNNININNESIFIYFISGILEAIGSIIPGISATALLMVLGTYNNIILAISNILDINYVISNLNIYIPYIIGIVLGIITVSIIMNYLFRNYNKETFSCILGIVLSNLIFLLIEVFSYNYQIKELIIGFILLVLGSIISFCLED